MTMADLSEASYVGKTTICRFESGEPCLRTTAAALERAFIDAGITFTDQGGVNPPAIETVEGDPA